MFGNYSDYVFKVLLIVGPIVLVLLVLVADRRREARRLIASGSPLAVPPSAPGAMEGLTAFLISLIGLPLLSHRHLQPDRGVSRSSHARKKDDAGEVRFLAASRVR